MAFDANDAPLIDVSDVTLDDLEGMEESVLAASLQRFARERQSKADGITAHTSTQHTSTFSQSPW